jgi:tetratricopeptide (TPR) repeat protein
LNRESRLVLFLFVVGVTCFCFARPAACQPSLSAGQDDQARSTVSLAEKAFTEGRFADAIMLYSDAIRLSPNDSSLYLGRGMSSEMAGKTTKAAADYHKALERDPHNYRAMENLAGIYERSRKRRAEAIELYRKALALDPRPEWQENLAVWIEMLRSASTTGSASAVALWHRGNKEAAHGNFEKAEESYSESLALNPLLYQAHFSLGLLRAKRGDYRAAISHFDRVLAIDPRFTRALVRRGLALEALGQPQAARQDFHRATLISPREVEPYYHLGRMLEAAGEYQAALASYERALKLRPKPKVAGPIRERISKLRPVVKSALNRGRKDSRRGKRPW